MCGTLLPWLGLCLFATLSTAVAQASGSATESASGTNLLPIVLWLAMPLILVVGSLIGTFVAIGAGRAGRMLLRRLGAGQQRSCEFARLAPSEESRAEAA